MSHNDKEFLYHDLPSIQPRVSRKERLSLQGHCTECKPDYIEKAKQSSRFLYFFYLSILVIGIVGIHIFRSKNKDNYTIKEQTKNFSVSFFKKATVTFINQKPNRYGISVLFRNNDFKNWRISDITVSNTLTHTTNNIIIDQTIKQKEFYSLFIPLSEEYENLDSISLTVSP